MFELLGGRLSEAHLDDSPAIAAQPLRKLLGRFKKVVLRVADACLNRKDRVLLIPSRSPVKRLRSTGFINSVPCIASVVQFKPSLQQDLLLGLVSLHGFVSKAKQQMLLQGQLFYQPTKLVYRGVPPWRKVCVCFRMFSSRMPTSWSTRSTNYPLPALADL